MSNKTPKTTVISLRVPIEQREAIERAAVAAGASVSGFIAATMAEALTGKQKSSRTAAAPSVEQVTRAVGISLSDPAALAELKRIGININQIAHAANGGLPLRPAESVGTFAQLFVVLSDPIAFKARLEQLAAVLAMPAPPEHAPAPQPMRRTPRLPMTPSPPLPTSGRPEAKPEPRPAVAPTPRPAVARQSFYPEPPSLAPVPPSPLAPLRAKPKATTHDSPYPRTRHQLQSSPELRPARPAERNDRTGRLGFFRKLWDG